MPIEIGEVSSTVRTLDGEAMLSPRVMERIVAAVVRALKDGDAREQRAQAERRVTGGVSDERETER
jgi:hypothetical protein